MMSFYASATVFYMHIPTEVKDKYVDCSFGQNDGDARGHPVLC